MSNGNARGPRAGSRRFWVVRRPRPSWRRSRPASSVAGRTEMIHANSHPRETGIGIDVAPAWAPADSPHQRLPAHLNPLLRKYQAEDGHRWIQCLQGSYHGTGVYGGNEALHYALATGADVFECIKGALRMMHCKLSRSGEVVLLVFLFLPWLGSCQRRRSAADPVQSARSELERMVLNMESSPNGTDIQRRLIKAMNEAVSELNDKSAANLSEPLPVVAIFGALDRVKGGFSLSIEWVDPGVDATGIFVLPANGDELVFDHVIKWTPADLDTFQANAYLRMGFPIQFDEASTKAREGVHELWPALKVNLDQLTNGARVGLITKDGRRTKTIEIFLDTPVRGHSATQPTG